MTKFFLTNKAVIDLGNIWEYTCSRWSENQADKYYKFLLSNFKEIAANPSIGKTYDRVTSDLLGLKASKHIIFYRKQDDNTVLIIRILHGKMDLKNRILEK